jgi:urea carboxylase system permease
LSQPQTDDVRDLASFGYKQVLDRTLGSFSSFAAGFSYISILTGVFQMFYVGYGAGGPAFYWTWPLVFFGQLMVALCFAELAARFPLSGGIYQWSRWIGSSGLGWMAGWVYLSGSVISLAAVALALQATLPQISPAFQWVGDAANPSDSAKNAVLLGCLLIGLTTVINSIGVRLMARINNVGVVAELIGVTVLIVLLGLHMRRGPSILFDMQSHGDGRTGGYLGPFLAAALMASYVLYGFDTAGTLAEETDLPRQRAPWAILHALAAAGIAGALLMFFGILAVSDPTRPELGRISGGLPFLVKDVLGPNLGIFLLLEVIFAVFVCALAVHAGSVRLMFAMARDNNLPFAHSLAHVQAWSKAPIVPSIVVGVLAASILVVNINLPNVIETLCSVAIVWANLAYLLVTTPLLLSRLRRSDHALDRSGQTLPGAGNSRHPSLARPVGVAFGTCDKSRDTAGSSEAGRRSSLEFTPENPEGGSPYFSLGRWGLPVNAVAVAWGLVVVINVSWPRTEIYGSGGWSRFAAPLATLGLVVLGAVYFLLFKRRRTGILSEHAADDMLESRTVAAEPGPSETRWLGQLAPGE